MTRRWRGNGIPHGVVHVIPYLHVCSVNHLADILRQAIENEQKLLNEIVLPGAKFHIREVPSIHQPCLYHSPFPLQSIIMFVPTPPPSPPLPVELPDPAYFTVDQLRHLHQQLYSAAPSGFLLVRMLVDTLQNMINRSSKDDLFPQLWRNASKQQVCTCDMLLYNHR